MKSKLKLSNRIDTPKYLKKKAFYDQLITVYGRKPVLEILEDLSIEIYRLHLADSNRSGGIIDQILSLAKHRGIETLHHNRSELARISRNSKQDQGVACDIYCSGYQSFDQIKESLVAGLPKTLIALDGINNPQNLGMIIRSVTASPCFGLLIPAKGIPDMSPLVIKASAGTIFKGNIIRCTNLLDTLKILKDSGFLICMLASHDMVPLSTLSSNISVVFVLGNESIGVSHQIEEICDCRVGISMRNNVESLNVAVTAALVAFSRI